MEKINKSIKNDSPNFIVIGAPKSGTTSLFYYLKQHPEIYLPTRKELHYFSYEDLKKSINGIGDANVLSGLISDIKEYKSHYNKVNSEKAIGEISPSYLYYSDSAKKIYDTLGKIKIIIILRNPFEKAYSQYMHLVRDKRETLSFWDALQIEKQRMKEGWSDIWRYAESSLYTDRIKTFINVFGKSNVKIILFEDFISETNSVMKDIFKFLNVENDIILNTNKIYNKSGKSKSKLIARFFSAPNLLKTVIKKMIPEKIRIPIRLFILDRNTGNKEEIDKKSKISLKEYFLKDIKNLEILINKNTGWID